MIFAVGKCVIFGLAAGAVTATGYFAVINSVGIINRMADVTKTQSSLVLYEIMIWMGAMAGNVLSLWNISCLAGTLTGIIVAVGVIAGMFVGLLIVSIAETTKAVPIFSRRMPIGKGLGIIVVALGLGKAFGHLVYYYYLY